MAELVKWLKDNIGPSITIVTPQFERSEELISRWKPETEKQFRVITNKAPWTILFGLGFRKWDTMHNLVKENIQSASRKPFQIPIINGSPGETMAFKPKHGPTVYPPVDEDVILIPGEWYDSIPDGFIVTGLCGEEYPFKRGASDNDIRFGCLPYGIKKALEKLKEVEG